MYAAACQSRQGRRRLQIGVLTVLNFTYIKKEDLQKFNEEWRRHHVYRRIHTVHFGEYAECKHNLCHFLFLAVNFCLQENVHRAPLNPLDAYLDLSVDGICPSVPAAHLLMPDTQWPVIAALCSLLSSLLLDAVEECAGHSFPLPCCLGSCQLKSRLPFVCGCRTATPAASTCRHSQLFS